MSQYDPSESLIEIKRKAKELSEILAPSDPDRDYVFLAANDIVRAAQKIIDWTN
jgi:hypothetical protein